MKNLQDRLISSILLLCFCFGVFAVGSVYAARPAPGANESASIFAPDDKNISTQACVGIEPPSATFCRHRLPSLGKATSLNFLMIPNLKIYEKLYSESGAMPSAIKLKLKWSKPDNDNLEVHPLYRRIIAHHPPIDLKRLAFANLQPRIVRLE